MDDFLFEPEQEEAEPDGPVMVVLARAESVAEQEAVERAMFAVMNDPTDLRNLPMAYFVINKNGELELEITDSDRRMLAWMGITEDEYRYLIGGPL